MCENFIKGLFGGGSDTTAQMQALFGKLSADARSAGDVAAAEAKKARETALAAMVDPRDSEQARRASERKQRRLIAGAGPEPLDSFGAAPVAYQLLTGK